MINELEATYDDDRETVNLAITQSDHSSLVIQMTFIAWARFVDNHRECDDKYITLDIPISDTAIQKTRVLTRNFRVLVAQYDLKNNRAGDE